MRRAVLVLDLINDVVSPDGAFARAGYARQVAEGGVLGRVSAAVAAARAAGDLVVWVAVGFRADYADWPAGSPLFAGVPTIGALVRGGWGTEFPPELDVRPGDPVVVKSRVSPFHGTELGEILRRAGVGAVTLAGVATDHVVLAAATEAHDRDLEVEVLADCCVAATPELHEAALLVLRSIATVRN